MIVLDASAAVELVLATPLGEAVSGRVDDPQVGLHAPHLIDAEVAQALRRLTQTRAVSEVRAFEALTDFVALDVIRYPHELLLPRVWELRENVTAYDALYIALAELLEAPLLTTDVRLEGVPGVSARVDVVDGGAR